MMTAVLKLALTVATLLKVECVQVTTQNGVVEGLQSATSDLGTTYYVFHGLPYAQPPIKNLRFEPPQPPSNWTGVYNATYERSICTQTAVPDVLTISGSEDCLYLNVYTPQLPASNNSLLPVMFWIYGGGFLFGSGNYDQGGPDYLLDQNVVVVTINYRLGAFGFLSTQDMALPGNNGLKDQILALKWVQSNINTFGGDPNRITIFGESAGSTSVSYLLQSNLTKGLYQAAIMESGVTLCPWTLARAARKFAFDVGRRLLISTDDSNELVRRLKTVNYKLLHMASVNILTLINLFSDLNGFTLAPVQEPEHSGAVFSSLSHLQLQNGDYNDVPRLLGFNSEEGLGFASLINLEKIQLIQYDLNKNLLVPDDMNIVDETDARVVGALIYDYYTNGSATTFLLSSTAAYKYFSDDEFVRPILEYVRLLIQTSSYPTYYYRFAYEGNLGNPDRGNTIGVGHGEDVNYIFRIPDSSDTADESDVAIRDCLVSLWTNFAKFLNPTPVSNPLCQNIVWDNASTTEDTSYINIDVNITMETNPEQNATAFWYFLYGQYANPPFGTF